MAEEPAAVIQLLRSQKAKLIEILSADPDDVLQHADSHCLLSLQGYQQIKACRTPSEKVTDLLDHIIQRGPKAAQGLLELLKEQALQETFPMLSFVKDLESNALLSGKNETLGKRQATPDPHETIPSKQICRKDGILFTHNYSAENDVESFTNFFLPPRKGSCLVTEKQLMIVARAIGKSWREIGRLALDVPSVKLEQFEEDNSRHVERVFAMLVYWRICQKEKATAAHLHALLSQEDWALPPEKIDFLLKTD